MRHLNLFIIQTFNVIGQKKRSRDYREQKKWDNMGKTKMAIFRKVVQSGKKVFKQI